MRVSEEQRSVEIIDWFNRFDYISLKKIFSFIFNCHPSRKFQLFSIQRCLFFSQFKFNDLYRQTDLLQWDRQYRDCFVFCTNSASEIRFPMNSVVFLGFVLFAFTKGKIAWKDSGESNSLNLGETCESPQLTVTSYSTTDARLTTESAAQLEITVKCKSGKQVWIAFNLFGKTILCSSRAHSMLISMDT